MSWNPNAGQDPNQAGQYGGGYAPQQPNPNDPYSGQQYAQPGAAPQYDPNSGGQQYGQYAQPGAAPQYDPNSGQQYGQPGGYQQPGQQQPGYGQQQQQYSYQPPFGAQMGGPGASSDAHAPTSLGMQANIAGLLTYLFTPISAVIIFFMEKQNRFVRFHAVQALFLGVVAVVAEGILLPILEHIPILGFLFAFIAPILGLAFFIIVVFMMYQAYLGKEYKLPLIGDYARKYVDTGKFQ